MQKCFVVDALFVDFNVIGDGSVINLDNVALTILCSVFKENTVTQNGGSIYISNTNFNISKTTFFHCQSSANKNDISGNAIYQINGQSFLQHNSLLLCAKSIEVRADSSIKLVQTSAKCTNLNFTSNHGSGGASGLAIWQTNTDSFVSYINVYDVLDCYSMEAHLNHYQITLSNFVKYNPNLNINVVWMSHENLLTFNNCCFFETNGVGFSYGNLNVVITNCIMGEENPSFTYASSKTLKEIILDLKCQPILRTCQVKIINNISIKLTLFAFIIMMK